MSQGSKLPGLRLGGVLRACLGKADQSQKIQSGPQYFEFELLLLPQFELVAITQGFLDKVARCLP